jgi:dihydrofolate synthase / folylpolyglutamate synthase
MKYRGAVAYLESFQKMGIRLGLDRIRTLLSHLGNPQNAYKMIHIAGTNGKGSVAAMLSSILKQAGYNVGLYTSPHLVDYTERIRINDKDVSKEKFAAAVEAVKKVINRLPEMDLTEFEVLTAASFLLLSREEVEIVVVETGLGGSMDATNVIIPILSIITNIDYDHMDVLGGTLNQIAKEKGGIIKGHVPLVTGEKKVWRILSNICKEKRARFIRSVSEKVKYSPFPGAHQVENTKTVIASVKVLNQLGIRITGAQMDKGLRKAYWPGRLQIVSKNPLTILDGAHNPAGAKALADHLSSLKKKFVFVIGMQRNKDIDSVIKILIPVADRFIVVKSSNPNAVSKEVLAKKIGKAGGRAVIAKDLKGALAMAKKTGSPVCVAGSLYLIGDVLKRRIKWQR